MPPLSPWRLNALRGLYLLMAVGLAAVIWPSLLGRPPAVPGPSSVVQALLGALGLLCVLGLRYPVKFLPLLVFELLWKLVWALAVAWPAWWAGQLGAYGQATLWECLPAFVLFPLILPWRYILSSYILAPSEPWRFPPASD